MTKVIIADDHPVVVIAIQSLLEKNGYEVVASASSGTEAIRLIQQFKPNIVILDIGLPQLDGLEVMKRVAIHNEKIKFLILTAQTPEHYIKRCIDVGASGFVSKEHDLREILTGIKAVEAGYSYFPNIGNNKLLNKDYENISKLSARELTIMKSLVKGLSNKKISEELFLSEKTISTYKTRVMQKLNAKNLIDLIEICQRNDLS